VPPGEQWRTYYPGLIPIEAELWRRWLPEHETEFQAFEYDAHIGEGVRIPSNPALGLSPELERRQTEAFVRATQKKVDVIGYRADATWLFEVEERPGTRALGQLLTYRALVPRYREIRGPVELVLICRWLGPDLFQAFDDAGVLIWQQVAPGSFERVGSK
jgi:hypothetical protein